MILSVQLSPSGAISLTTTCTTFPAFALMSHHVELFTSLSESVILHRMWIEGTEFKWSKEAAN
jgi:hypothetical protein